MTEKQTYWIADVEGVKAVVEGADARDLWTRVRGWTATTEPAPGDRVWLRNETHDGRQVFAAAAAPHWAGLGWVPSDPPEPIDPTKDPLLVDQPPVVAPVVEPEKPVKSRAASGADKE
jgi:hypothetical protein